MKKNVFPGILAQCEFLHFRFSYAFQHFKAPVPKWCPKRPGILGDGLWLKKSVNQKLCAMLGLFIRYRMGLRSREVPENSFSVLKCSVHKTLGFAFGLVLKRVF